MTPPETLIKYGLDTSVKAIKERMEQKELGYFELGRTVIYKANEPFTIKHMTEVENALYSADLSLLCSFAEKGERETELLNLYRKFFKETNISIGLDDCDVDDVSSTFEYVDIENDTAEVDTVKGIQELEAKLEAEGEGK